MPDTIERKTFQAFDVKADAETGVLEAIVSVFGNVDNGGEVRVSAGPYGGHVLHLGPFDVVAGLAAGRRVGFVESERGSGIGVPQVDLDLGDSQSGSQRVDRHAYFHSPASSQRARELERAPRQAALS